MAIVQTLLHVSHYVNYTSTLLENLYGLRSTDYVLCTTYCGVPTIDTMPPQLLEWKMREGS